MEPGASFDLNAEVVRWRQRLVHHQALTAEEIDELEDHLWDEVEARLGAGATPGDAFLAATRRLGGDASLAAEFRKVEVRRRASRPRWQHHPLVPLMLTNYAKIALRTLRRHKGYAFISISGLAAGIACCLLILLFVQDELRYDRYHEKADRVYRLVKGNSANSPELWAPALTVAFPEVEHAVRLMEGFSRALVTYEEHRFQEPDGLYADAALFDVFSWPLLQGDPASALRDPFSVVLTEPMAAQFFGDADPIGQVLTIGGISNDAQQREYKVTGVMGAVPRTSHVRVDYLISFATVETLNDAGEWGTPLSWDNRMVKTYVLLPENGDPQRLEAQLPAFLRRHITDAQYDVTDARLQALTDIHLHSDLRSEFMPGGNITYVYLFSALAAFILVIACVNFMNLATARSQQRGREVGMRKVLGAQRMQLARQFLGESILQSLLALTMALLLLVGLHPAFETLTGKPLPFDLGTGVPVLLGFLGLALGVGALAGMYPALLLSAFKPAHVLKGDADQGTRGALIRQGLVVFQFVISIALMISTVVVYDQLDYLKNKDLGFQDEQIVVLPIGHSRQLREKAEVVKQELMQHPHVVSVSASHSIPSYWLNGFFYRPEGAAQSDRISLRDVSIDHAFIDTYRMAVLAGRSFSRDLAGDSTAFVLNESAVRAFGWTSADEAVGKQIEWLFPNVGFQGPVIGVIQDFHYGSLREVIPPIVFHISRFGSGFISARIRPDEARQTLASLEQLWHRFEPDYPFEYFFVDEQFAMLYAAEERLGRTFGYGASLAILIACLGLFGLAAFMAERRKKEIGVRKVLGASVFGVALLFSRDFLKLVGVAFIVSCPIAYIGMDIWLQNFAYRIEIRPREFLMAGLAALIIALLTVSYQSIRTALADPVKSLRYE